MGGLVTLVISLLVGAVIVTLTCPPTVAVITVCGICFIGAIVKAKGVS